MHKTMVGSLLSLHIEGNLSPFPVLDRGTKEILEKLVVKLFTVVMVGRPAVWEAVGLDSFRLFPHQRIYHTVM